MEFDQYYVVLLKKGPNWTGESSPELEKLQTQHLAHLAKLFEQGLLRIAGPVQDHREAGDTRGISIFPKEAIESLDDLKALVETDTMFQMGHLAADYMTWYVPQGSNLLPQKHDEH